MPARSLERAWTGLPDFVRESIGFSGAFCMHCCYSSDELKSLVRTLNDILSDARKCRSDLSTDDIVQRVCALADRGERDVQSLRKSVFGAGPSGAARQTLSFANRKLATAEMSEAR